MKLKTITLVISIIALQACSTKKSIQPGITQLWVSGFKTECNANTVEKSCFLVAYEEDVNNAKWEKLDTNIKNFQFIPGTMQHIEVLVDKVPESETTANRSTFNYTLVRVLDKEKDTRSAMQGEWILDDMQGVNLKNAKAVPSIAIDLGTNQISGNDGCNSFSGSIKEVSFKTIRFDRGITTLMACDNMPNADQFNVALDKVRSYKVRKNRLVFYDARNNELFTFEKKPVLTANTRINDIWVVLAINGTPVAKRDNMPRLELNLNAMQLFGNNGCNEYNGKITAVTEKKISFGNVASTKMMCPEMQLSNSFDQALQKVASYKHANLNLVFYDKAGKEVLKFLKVD